MYNKWSFSGRIRCKKYKNYHTTSQSCHNCADEWWFSREKININSEKTPEATVQNRLKRIENTIAWMTVSMNLDYYSTEKMQSWRQAYYICSLMGGGGEENGMFDRIKDTD